MGWAHVLAKSILNIDVFKDWFTWQNQFIVLVLLVYAFVALWSDVNERRIPNVYTGIAFVVIMVFQIIFHHFETSSIAVLILLVTLLPPTLLGLWGQGDWKMSAVYGAAIGVVPSLVVWLTGYLLIPYLKPILLRMSSDRLKPTQVKSIPLAAPITLAMAIAYVVVTIMIYMGW
jgi:Flp pilus assembly protein protease CpaA